MGFVFQLMRQFTIRFRMVAAIGVVLGLLALFGAASWWGVVRAQAQSAQLAQQLETVMGAMQAAAAPTSPAEASVARGPSPQAAAQAWAEGQRALAAARQEQQAHQQRMVWIFLVFSVIAVTVVAPLTLLNMRAICAPVEQARSLAQAISGGDLSQPVQASGRDEVADLLRALETMRQGLVSMVTQVRQASDSIATGSHEIATGNLDLSARTEQTAGHVQQTASAIETLGSHVQQTSESAATANQLVSATSAAAMRGGEVVGQAVHSMQSIAQASQRISDIIGLIDSIAFQTNILALNAAVEAARAGEQGRGFAVVASEVRSLAQRSATAASEIKGLIGNSVVAVDGGVKLVEQAGAVMTEIVTGVRQVSDIFAEIVVAARAQSQGIGSVNTSVHEIDQMTQQNAALVEQSAAAAQSMQEQADRLASLVRQFRLAA